MTTIRVAGDHALGDSPMATTFWTWRRGGASSAIDGSAALQAVEELEPVEIYTRAAMVTGSVVSHGERMSDILNQHSELRVRAPRALPYGEVDELPSFDQGVWAALGVDEILFVMPPSHVSHPQRRVHRRQRRVLMRTGEFEIVGTAHLLPGTELSPFALATRVHFMPVTKATVRSTNDPFWERSADVVLVNVRPLEDLREVVTIS
jgi:hypothetical protein